MSHINYMTFKKLDSLNVLICIVVVLCYIYFTDYINIYFIDFNYVIKPINRLTNIGEKNQSRLEEVYILVPVNMFKAGGC